MVYKNNVDMRMSKKMQSVCVLMSTYNGEKYLEEQLESLNRQKNVKVTLYVRDDGSIDNTMHIIKNRPEYGKNLFLLQGQNIGVERSFYELIRYVCSLKSTYDFYAFADQDDVWKDEKLYVALKVLEKYEDDVPNLYYSNLDVVSEQLDYLFAKFEKGYVKNTKQQILTEICTWGCTCVFNYAALLEMNKCQTFFYDYHDNWLTWICAFLGNMYYDENSYILYRQHDNNTSGTVEKGFQFLLKQTRKIKRIKKMSPEYEVRAKHFLEIYSEDLLIEDKYLLHIIADYKHNFKYKVILLLTNKISSGHIVREIIRRIRIIYNVL